MKVDKFGLALVRHSPSTCYSFKANRRALTGTRPQSQRRKARACLPGRVRRRGQHFWLADER